MLRNTSSPETYFQTAFRVQSSWTARDEEGAVLVNVDHATLTRLMNSPEAMQALMNIEGFRSLNEDIETIINKSEKVKKNSKQSIIKQI